jgi:hypothetical protein
MNMRNRVLAAVFGLQVIVLVVVFWPEAEPPPPEQLIPGLTQDQVAIVSIADPSGDNIRLEVTSEGCSLPNAGDYPCLRTELDSLLAKIVAMTTDHVVTRTAASHARLGVSDDNFGRLIELELVDDTSIQLYLGTSPRVGSLHVRLGDRQEVYLINGIFESDAQVEALPWIEPVYYKVPQSDVTALSLKNSKGSFELRKNDAGEWAFSDMQEGEEIDQGAARGFVYRVTSLSIRRPLGTTEGGDYGLQDPAAQVEYETKDADGNVATHTLVVGAAVEGIDEYIAKSSVVPQYMTMGAYSVGDFLQKERRDFLLPAPPESDSESSTTP